MITMMKHLTQFEMTASMRYYIMINFRILALEKLGAVFNQVATPLEYTPRKFVIHPESNNLIIIETDHNAYTEKTKGIRKRQMAEVSISDFAFVVYNFHSVIQPEYFTGFNMTEYVVYLNEYLLFLLR